MIIKELHRLGKHRKGVVLHMTRTQGSHKLEREEEKLSEEARRGL